MKTTIISLIMVVSFALTTTAQDGSCHKQQCQNIPDLTEAQQKSIDEIDFAFHKEIFPLFMQIGELDAKMNTLITAENVDLDAVNTLIDKMSVLKADIHKKKMKKHNDVRNLLNEEQRFAYDMHFVHSPKEHHGQRPNGHQKQSGQKKSCGEQHQSKEKCQGQQHKNH
jgi:Spy/CpxP family protein refolding chaperone